MTSAYYMQIRPSQHHVIVAPVNVTTAKIMIASQFSEGSEFANITDALD